MRAIRFKNGIWSVTSIVRDGSELGVWFGESIGEDDRGEVDLLDGRDRGEGTFLVLLIYDIGNVGCIGTPVTFGGDVEWRAGVIGIPLQEQLHESIHVLCSDGASADRRAVRGVRITDVDRLVQEDHVGVGVPTVFVVSHVVSFIRDAARTEFKQQTGHRAASWSAVEPQSQRCFLRV